MLFLQLFWPILLRLWTDLHIMLRGSLKHNHGCQVHPSWKWLGLSFQVWSCAAIVFKSQCWDLVIYIILCEILSRRLTSVHKPYLLISQEDGEVTGNFLHVQTPAPHKMPKMCSIQFMQHLQLIILMPWGASQGHYFHYKHFQIISQMLLAPRGSLAKLELCFGIQGWSGVSGGGV